MCLKNGLKNELFITFLALVVLTFCTPYASAETYVSGDIKYNTTWTLAGSPYIVTGDIYVFETRQPILTIEAGVEVRFQAGRKLSIGLSRGGRLRAFGTQENPIIFTSDNVNPVPGDWNGIYFGEPSDHDNTIMRHCIIEYATNGINTYRAAPNIKNCTIRNCSGRGIDSNDDAPGPTIESCTIVNNIGTGVYFKQSSFSLKDNTISNNSGMAVSIPCTAVGRIISGNSGTGNAGGDYVEVRGGKIKYNTTWKKQDQSGLPLVVVGDILVYNETNTRWLTIEPGVKVRFQAGKGITVGGWNRPGVLRAQGTAGDPIIFTSAQSNPAPGDWKGIYFYITTDYTNTILEHCIIEYGGSSGKYGSVTTENVSPVIKNCTVRYSSVDGIYCRHNDDYPGKIGATVENCTITNNNKKGVCFGYECSYFTLKDNTISNNGKVAASIPCEAVPNVSGNKGSGNMHDYIEVRGGYLKSNMTWKKQALNDLPLVVNGYMYIGHYSTDPSNVARLTVEPGTTIRFELKETSSESGFIVGYYGHVGSVNKGHHHGALFAQGTKSEPIIFTSNANTPAPGDWAGISFGDEASNTMTLMEYCTVEYGGGYLNNANIWCNNSSPPIINCTIQHSGQHGIYLNNFAGTISNCTIRNNQTGIYIKSLITSISINNNIIEDNGKGLHNNDTRGYFIVDARYNFWGHPSGPYDGSSFGYFNRFGQGNEVSDYVVYFPWRWMPDPDATVLTLGVPREESINVFQTQYFSLDAAAGNSLIVEIVPQTGITDLILSEKSGKYSTATLTPRGTYELLIPNTQQETYHLSIFGYNIAMSGGLYTITARYMNQPYISNVAPRSAINTGKSTLCIEGLNLSENTQVALAGGPGPVPAPEAAILFSPAKLYVTFDLNGVQTGTYSVQINNSSDANCVLENAFEVKSEGIPGHLTVDAKVPKGVRPWRNYAGLLSYKNDGGSNLNAPLFAISNDKDVPMTLTRNSPYRKGNMQVLGIGSGGSVGTIIPGNSNNLCFFSSMKGFGGGTKISYNIEKLETETNPEIDWDSMKADIKPADIDSGAWDIIWNNFREKVGETTNDYVHMLNLDAIYLSAYRNAKTGNLVGSSFLVNILAKIIWHYFANIIWHKIGYYLAINGCFRLGSS